MSDKESLSINDRLKQAEIKRLEAEASQLEAEHLKFLVRDFNVQ